MKVELLYIRDCPNRSAAGRTLRQILHEHGLAEEVSEIAVTEFAQAQALAFPGSPTIRVDGRDIDPGLAGAGNCGLACRTYVVDGKRQGFPSREMIARAIDSAIEREGGTSHGGSA